MKEKHLAQTFIGEDANGNRRGVRDGNGDESFPFRFEWCDVHQNAGSRIGGFTNAERQYITRDAEVLDSSPQDVAVCRNIARRSTMLAIVFRRNGLWIQHRIAWRREYFELIGQTKIVTVRRQSVRDRAFCNLRRTERLDHVVGLGHVSYPSIGFNCHCLTRLLMLKVCTKYCNRGL